MAYTDHPVGLRFSPMLLRIGRKLNIIISMQVKNERAAVHENKKIGAWWTQRKKLKKVFFEIPERQKPRLAIARFLLFELRAWDKAFIIQSRQR
ncbi:hypothetical protein WCE14_09320 [Acinetobacter schindleri]|uniref:hypothetical protein n=1 Tax=Acinetobacter schindleri TaxID=108981 RepID=UPI0034D6424A